MSRISAPLAPLGRFGRWWDPRVMGAASAVLVLAAVTGSAAWTGSDALAAPATAARMARTAVVLVIPAAVVIALAVWEMRRPGVGWVRTLAAVGMGGLLAGIAAWRWEEGGYALPPAALLLALTALPEIRREEATAAVRRPARTELVMATAVTAAVGVVGRSVTLEEVGGLLGRLNALVVGLVLLAWPLVGSAFLPRRWRVRGMLGVAAAVTATVVWRAPAGGEEWLVPAVALAVLAAFTPPEVATAVVRAEAPGRPGPNAIEPDRALLRSAGLLSFAVLIGLAGATLIDREMSSVGELLAALAAVPVLVATAFRGRISWPAGGPWLPVGGALAALSLAIGLLATPAATGGSGPVTLASGKVSDGQAAINRADARFLVDATAIGEIVPGARCYFVEEGDGNRYADHVACGPLQPASIAATSDEELPDDSEDLSEEDEADEGLTEPSLDPAVDGAATWVVYPVTAAMGWLEIGTSPNTAGQIDPTLLYRPDDLRPPDDTGDSQSGQVVATDYAGQLFDTPADAQPAGGYVMAGNNKVTVASLAWPETVQSSDFEGELRAPEGSRFVAVELAFEKEVSEVEGLSLEVADGDRTVDLTDVVQADGEWYQDGWVVFVAADDGFEPTLEVTYRRETQRLSLADGERIGGDPLLYEPLSEELNHEVDDEELPLPDDAYSPLTGYTVARAELRAFDEEWGWAPPGEAWLVVTIEGLPTSSTSYSSDGDQLLRMDPYRSFEVETDGDPIYPMGASDSMERNTTGLDLGFRVDGFTRSATLRAAPFWQLIAGEEITDMPLREVEVELSF